MPVMNWQVSPPLRYVDRHKCTINFEIIYNFVDSGKDGADRYDSYRDHFPAGIAKSTGAAGKQEPDFRYFFL